MKCNFLQMASHLRFRKDLRADVKDGCMRLELLQKEAEVTQRLVTKFGERHVRPFLQWLQQASQTDLPLKAMAGVRLLGETPSEFHLEYKAHLPHASGQKQPATFQIIPYDILLLITPEDEGFYSIISDGSPRGINLVAYTEQKVIGQSVGHQYRFVTPEEPNGWEIVKSSEAMKFDDDLKQISFVFQLIRYQYMIQAGILENRPSTAPVANNILESLIRSWCRLAGIPLEGDLDKNHRRGILTRGELEAMWQYAVHSGLIESSPQEPFFSPEVHAFLQAASALFASTNSPFF